MRALFPLLLALVMGLSSGAHAQFEQAKPWLGVAIEEGKDGVRVKEVLPNTPAMEYGLMKGDEITGIGDTKVKKPDELIHAIQNSGVGNKVVVHYVRAGKADKKEVKLVARPDQLELLKNALVNKPAPIFNLPVIAGKESGDSTKLKGKTTLVEFWATWCPACRSTHGRLNDWTMKHPDIQVVAIADDGVDELKEYVKDKKPAFTVLRDATHEVSQSFMVAAIPMLVVIDRTGKVTFATIGAGEYLEEALAAAELAAK